MSIVITASPVHNSTSYIDLLGVLAGLDRLTGESSADFAERIRLSAAMDRGAHYIGMMNELTLELGLTMRHAVHITDTTGNYQVDVSLAGIELQSSAENRHIDVLGLTSDNFWHWKQISEIVAEINQSLYYQATLVGPDGPALTLVRQSNTVLVVGEPIQGKTVQLNKAKLVIGSESFSTKVPSYTVGSDSDTLRFSAPVPDGTAITYRFRACPYDLIASPVALLSLADPDLQVKALTPNGGVIYQVREYLQDIVKRDRSYWGA